MTWVSAEELSRHLVGDTTLATDANVVATAAAADAWCKRRRTDLDATANPGADVKLGAVMYAAYLYRQRGGTTVASAPDLDVALDGDGLTTVYQLLGRKPRIG